MPTATTPMRMTGRTDIAAPPGEVWGFVLDPARLASCVPGLDGVRQVDPRTFEGTINASVGPMSGAFAFTSRIVRADFPGDLLVEIVGEDSVTHSRVAMSVAAAMGGAERHTNLDYTLTVDVSGRLAILGEMILRASAGAVVAQVSSCIRDRLEEAAGDRPIRPAVAGPGAEQ
jgi:carbon monoxide dehydrogenase subunit G